MPDKAASGCGAVGLAGCGWGHGTRVDGGVIAIILWWMFGEIHEVVEGALM